MQKLNPDRKTATAFAPATVANVAVGFDILGFPIESVGDTITLTRRTDNAIVIEKIISLDKLPSDPAKNTASIALQALLQHLNFDCGFDIVIQKGIPLNSGMGGSAASAVAALVAFNEFLTTPLDKSELMPFALQAEASASGAMHGDNVVPCLYGGLTLIRSVEPLSIVALPLPNIYCVLVHPHLKVSTHYARQILPQSFSLKSVTQQAANLATFISALYQNDIDLLATCLHDVLIEPFRAPLIKNFFSVKDAALRENSLGCSISGSGPSIFAFAKSLQHAERISVRMIEAFNATGISADHWVSRLLPTGAFSIPNSGKK